MGKTAHVFSESPPFASLNISGHFGGLPETSAWNHRSFLLVQNYYFFGSPQGFRLKKAIGRKAGRYPTGLGGPEWPTGGEAMA